MMIHLLTLFFAASSYAYLPPAFFVYEQLATLREKSRSPSEFVLAVTKTPNGKSEEFLGTFALPDSAASVDSWPVASLLFSKDGEAITKAVENFGVPVVRETNLLRSTKEKIAALKDAPRNYYNRDPRMHMRRFKAYVAWVHEEKDLHSVWLEKDSFLPLKVTGPCPSQLEKYLDTTASSKCEVEFKSIYGHRRGEFQNAKVLIHKEGAASALTFSLQERAKQEQLILSEESNMKELLSVLFH